MSRLRNIVRRCMKSYRDWQEPAWEFRPLREHSVEYRLYVIIAIPMAVLSAFFVAVLVGVHFGIHSPELVAIGVGVTALLSPIVFKADSYTTVDAVAAIPVGMMLVGEVSGAIIAISVSMLVYALKTPLPIHQTVMFNTLGIGCWSILTAAITMELLAGGSAEFSAIWLVGAYSATLIYFASMLYPAIVGNVLGDYISMREAMATWRTTVRTEFVTLSTITVMGAGAILAGGWWYVFVLATPMLTAWETYRRTNQYAEARNDAERDALTGLYNRRALEIRLEQAIASAAAQPPHDRRADDRISAWLIMCDLDDFKRLNDVHGHATGDEALVLAASVLRDSTRIVDTCARFGGEELVVILRDLDEPDALAVAERLRSGAFERLGHLGTSMSVGVYRLETDESPESALHRADMAMYWSKTSGKNRVTLWSQSLMDDEAQAA